MSDDLQLTEIDILQRLMAHPTRSLRKRATGLRWLVLICLLIMSIGVIIYQVI